MRTVVFGGAAASSIKRNNPRAFHFSVERMTRASEKRRLQLEATLSSNIEKLSYTKFEMMQDLCHYAAQPDIPPDIAAILSGPRSEAKHLMPAKSSPRSELAMALAKWRRLAPEFCARAHLSQSNAEDPFDEMVSQQPSTLERRAAARARLKSQGKVVGLHSRLCERTLGPTPSTEDSAEALKKMAGRSPKCGSHEQDIQPMQKNDVVDARHFYRTKPNSYELEPVDMHIRELIIGYETRRKRV